MSDLKHTPEPWDENTHGNFGITHKALPTEDYKRALACVNACVGKHNPQRWIKEAESILQKIYDFEHPELKLGQSKLEFILKLAAQRDELLAALELAQQIILDQKAGYQHERQEIAFLISKAKGGQP